MTDKRVGRKSTSPLVTLIVRKTIRATAEKLFDAWTQPSQLTKWWGPESVTCIGADVDLRVGGRYRIGNRFPDGKVLWITGVFKLVDRAHKLVYTWAIEPDVSSSEVVTVSFKPRGQVTEVVVTHRRIPNNAARDMHRLGWRGCLGGLAAYLEGHGI
jgi:uncharacterized protein YndB with AHSA1/START domain